MTVQFSRDHLLERLFFPIDGLGTFVRNQLAIGNLGLFLDSQIYSIGLYDSLIPVPHWLLKLCNKFINHDESLYFISFSILFLCLWPLVVSYEFENHLSYFRFKTAIQILMEIIQVTWGSIAILTIFCFKKKIIHEHRMSFCPSRPLISFQWCFVILQGLSLLRG